MANVARPVHMAMGTRGWNVAFVSGLGNDSVNLNSYSAGWNGGGFRALPDTLMQSVVHIHGIWTFFERQAFREARKRHAKIVMSPHGALERWAFDHKPVKKRLAWLIYQRHILQQADLLIVNSEQERQRLRCLGLKPAIATIPNGIDLEGFSSCHASQNRERIVLFFSRIDPKKGLPDLIKAWSSIVDYRGYQLHICGHGDQTYVEKIQKIIAATGQDNIKLMPPVFGPDRWRIFLQASLYVLPSYSENFGITVAEALLAGLPVITTRATPWACLEDEKLGWVIDNDIAQLRSALENAIALEPQKLADMQFRTQAYAAQHFDWPKIAQHYNDAYDWALYPSSKIPAFVDPN